MKNYNWNYPTTMWVGENRIIDLGNACKQLNIKSPLLVTDGGLVKTQMVLKKFKTNSSSSALAANAIIKYL